MKSMRLVFVWVGVCLLEIITVSEATSDPLRYRSGIRNAPNKYALNAKQMRALLVSLREKTGWPQLTFDEAGFLICDDREQFTGGSVAARTLLAAAITGTLAFDLESHNNELAITFASLAPGSLYQSLATGKRIDIFPLQIDFTDFNWLRGNAETLTTFDIGLVVLHELAHGVWRLRDAQSREDEPGECESYINRIRRELNLPERVNYFARVTHNGPDANSQNRPGAELVFVRRSFKAEKLKLEHQYLRWDASYVGLIQPDRVMQRTPAQLMTNTRH